MLKPTIVFFGTDEFGVRVLEKLTEASLTPLVIVTAPDRPQGRKMIVTPPPTKVWAQENNIDVLQPETLNKDFAQELMSMQPEAPHASGWDLFIVASYGKIIPKFVLDIPLHGTLNVHPSLLPKYRGATPIESQILADDRECGVTIMLMDEEVDHGSVVAQARIEIDKSDWPIKGSLLREMLAEEGGNLLAETISPWLRGKINSEEQDHGAATFTKRLRKEDGAIDLAGDPYKNFLKIQAFDSWPGTYFFVEHGGKQIRVKITGAKYKEGALQLTKVIPEGKKEMGYHDFLKGSA